MRTNRSIPRATIIPELPYPDPGAAADWLCKAFAFRIRLRIANHRVQLELGDAAVVCTEGAGRSTTLVRVEDANAHCARAKAAGAKVIRPLQDHPFGERQYTVEDLAGHAWTFSESIADVDPRDWGGLTEGSG